MLMPLMVIMAATALRVQWIFAGIKSTKIWKVTFILLKN
jgi:hypothetical protein